MEAKILVSVIAETMAGQVGGAPAQKGAGPAPTIHARGKSYRRIAPDAMLARMGVTF